MLAPEHWSSSKNLNLIKKNKITITIITDYENKKQSTSPKFSASYC